MGRGEGSGRQRRINYVNSLIFNERTRYYLKLTNQETHVLSEVFKAIMPLAATQMDLEMITLLLKLRLWSPVPNRKAETECCVK